MADHSLKISQTGLVARSPEGHAARGMQIRGNEDMWIEIQTHTFKNWVNEKLAVTGYQVQDLTSDLTDGVKLVYLVEVLVHRKLRKNPQPCNQHQCLANVSEALKAIEDDGVRLVNIGNVDIVNGNQKLILGLIWSLIIKYQIGQSKFPPKKLMLSWLQAALPGCNVSNLTSDWNSGRNLNALVDFCRPGLAPDWQQLDINNGVENNRRAMLLAKKHFGIPMVLEPEYFASPHVDELSGMTYLSYFMNKHGPGYQSTLDWVRNELPDERIDNFTTDWNDGRKIHKLASKYGAATDAQLKVSQHKYDWERNWERAIDLCVPLGVQPPTMTARDLTEPEVDYIGPMSYVSNFRWLPRRSPPPPPRAQTPPPPPPPRRALTPPRVVTSPPTPLSNGGHDVTPLPVRLVCSSRVARVNTPYEFVVEICDGRAAGVVIDDLIVGVDAADNAALAVTECRISGSAVYYQFTPRIMGMHQVAVDVRRPGGAELFGSPALVRVMPATLTLDHASGDNDIDPCAVGSTVEVVVNPSSHVEAGDLRVTAYSPWHQPVACQVSPVQHDDEEDEERGRGQQHQVYTASFRPHQVGEWLVHIVYDGQHISGSPFTCRVFDPNSVRIGELVGGGAGESFTFLLDTRDAGQGSVCVDIVWDGRSVPHTITNVDQDIHRVQAVLPHYGKYRLYVYFNGVEMKDNPFKLRVDKSGNHSITRRTTNNASHSRSHILTSTPLSTSKTTSEFHQTRDLLKASEMQTSDTGASENQRSRWLSYDTRHKLNGSSRPEQFYRTSVVEETNVKRRTIVRKSLSPPDVRLCQVEPSTYEKTRSHTQINKSYSTLPRGTSESEKCAYDSNDSRQSREFFTLPKRGHHYWHHEKKSSKKSAGRPHSRACEAQCYLNGTASEVSDSIVDHTRPASGKASPRRSLPITHDRVPHGGSHEENSDCVTAEHSSMRNGLVNSPHRLDESLEQQNRTINRSIRVSPNDSSRVWINDDSRATSRVSSKIRTIVRPPSCDEDTANPIQQASLEGDCVQGRDKSPSRYSTSRVHRVRHHSASPASKVDMRHVRQSSSPSSLPQHINSKNKVRRSSKRSSRTEQSQSKGVTGRQSQEGARAHCSNVDQHGGPNPNSPPIYSNIGHSRAHIDELSRVVGATSPRGEDHHGDGQTGVSESFNYSPSHHGRSESPETDFHHLQRLFDSCQSSVECEAVDGRHPQCRVTRYTKHLPDNSRVVREVHEILDSSGKTVGSTEQYSRHAADRVSSSSHSRTVLKEHRQYRVRPGSNAEVHCANRLTSCVTVDTLADTPLSHQQLHDFSRLDFGPPSHAPREHFDYDQEKHIRHLIKSARPDFDHASGEKIRVPIVGVDAIDSSTTLSLDSSRFQSPVRLISSKSTTEKKMSSITSSNHHTKSTRQRSTLIDTRASLPRSSVEAAPVSRRITACGDWLTTGVSLHCQAQLAFTTAADVKLQHIDAHVEDPSGNEISCTVTSSHQKYYINFSACEVGDHLVSVRVRGEPVHGAPFCVPVYNAAAVTVTGMTQATVGQPVQFNIDGSRAGCGSLEIEVDGGREQCEVEQLGEQRFSASFVPDTPARHTLTMRFNGHDVPGSPWVVDVVAMETGDKSRVAIEHLRHFASTKSVSFDIFTPQKCQSSDVLVEVTSPSSRSVNVSVSGKSRAGEADREGVFQCEFCTGEVGTHNIAVSVAGCPVVGSPFTCKAYNADLIQVSDIPSGVVGQACQFRVDASQAGEGQLEISINDGEVPNHVQVLGGGRCLVTFTPDTAKRHSVDIKFNGDPVPQCPLSCRVQPSSRVAVHLRHLELWPVRRSASFLITIDSAAAAAEATDSGGGGGGGGGAELAVSVRGPAHSTLPVSVTGNVRAGFTAEFTPRQLGAHTVLVEYNGVAVSGTPFTCKVYDAGRVTVTDIPPGAIGKQLHFTVDASEAGEGNLEIAIGAGGRNIPTQVHPHGAARFGVSFVPLEPADHAINISFNKQPIPGSPLTAVIQSDPNHIVVKGASLASTAVGKQSYFTLSNVSGNIEDVQVNVDGPGGADVATQVKDNGDGSMTVHFTPSLAGEHKIHASYAASPVPGSPFACKVYDVAAIRVKEMNKGVVGRPVSFLVETLNAGPGNLEVTVNNGQVPTSAQSQGQHRYAISFTPKQAKVHHVELKFNGEDVPGSPFACSVVDASQVTVSGAGLGKVPVGRATSFTVDTQGMHELSDLSVTVLSPVRCTIPAEVWSLDETKATVEYTPSEVGDHCIEVRLGGILVPGSPFIVKVYDVQKVSVTDVQNGLVSKPVYFCIDASQAGAGNLEIIVSVNGRNVPNYVQSEGNARFRVNFKPHEVADHVLSVRFNGEPVPGSPFTCHVTDTSQVVVSGQALKMAPLSRPAVFNIEPNGTALNDCCVIVTAPSGQSVPVQIESSGESAAGRAVGGDDGETSSVAAASQLYSVQFRATEVGPHTIAVSVAKQPALGSPFTCNIFDVARVIVSELTDTKVGRPVTFTVDASQAGEGTLELVVTTGKSTVRAEVSARSRGQYDVTFLPSEPIPHFINVTFNEQDVPGSPFKCAVSALDGREARNIQRRDSQLVIARGDGLKHVVTGSWATFDVDTKALDGDVAVVIVGPRGEDVPCRVVRLRSGVHRAEYRAVAVGTYSVSVLHNGRAVGAGGGGGGDGRPHLVEAADPSRVLVNPPSASLQAAKETLLKVDASQAGRGTLSVSVRAAGQEVKHSIRDLGSGQYQVIFSPSLAVTHKVDVKYNAVPVPGCPLVLEVQNPWRGRRVTASGAGLYQARAGLATSFVLDTVGRPGRQMDVIVTTPSGDAVPVKCYQQKDGNMLVEFTPNSAGAYSVDVLHEMKAIWGSPFTCQVFDASRVVIDEPAQKQFSINEKISVQLRRSGAGLAELDVAVTSPLGKNLPIDVTAAADDSEVIDFLPSVPGTYKLVINYGAHEIPGSPLTFAVEEEGCARASGEGLTRALVNTTSQFRLDASGLIGEPQVYVDGPDSVAKTVVEDVGGGQYLVSYTARETGVFDVRVLWNGKDIAGSPFHPRIVDLSKVRLIGGWESYHDNEGRVQLPVNQETRLTFDVSQAGPGKLRGEVRCGGSVLACRVEQPPALNTSPGGNQTVRSRLCFTVQQASQHLIYLYWSDCPLPGSPFIVHAVNESNTTTTTTTAGADDETDSSRVLMRGHALATARAGQRAEFIVDGSHAGPGKPEVHLSCGDRDVAVSMRHNGDNIYTVAYTAPTPGTYLLNVSWAGRQVKGCPLRVAVSGGVSGGGGAACVVCSGDALRVATVSREARCFIDARTAMSSSSGGDDDGQLTAHCAGPSSVAHCHLTDHRDGTFTLTVTPQQPGKHLLHVKYSGEHVTGSPFSVRVNAAPDAARVRVYGPGVEPGVLSLFQSRFMCDTRGAGAGQLTVRIRGPKGAFRVEMQRESQKDRLIMCKYDPTEPGDYRIEVRWAGDHVPGSPFAVSIFDTQDELNRHLHGGYSPGFSKMAPCAEFYGSIYGSGGGGGGHMSWRGSQVHL